MANASEPSTGGYVTQVLTAAQADAAWGPGCKPRGLTTVKVDGLLFTWINHSGAVQALTRLSDILVKHGYKVRAEDTGTYNCRFIKNTTTLSRHAKPTAIDINWRTNPDGSRLITDMPRAMVNDIVALRTNSGEQVWRWGGDWDTRPETPHGYYDAMHFELIAHPNDLETGIAEENELGAPAVARLFVVEAIKKGWLPWPANGTDNIGGVYWLKVADQINDPAKAAEWRRDFEPAWNTWKAKEAALIKTATSGVDTVARQAAAGAQARADSAHSLASGARKDLDEIKGVIG